MGKHDVDKYKAKIVADLINSNKFDQAKVVLRTMSPKARQEITDRIIKGMQISQGRHH